MPIETNIIMELKTPKERSFEQVVTVRRGSKVRFMVRIWERFLKMNIASNRIRFTLYFNKRPPEGFLKNSQVDFYEDGLQGSSRNTSDFDRDDAYTDVLLAEGIAAEYGRFKYGIKAEQGGEDLFDEDPILRII